MVRRVSQGRDRVQDAQHDWKRLQAKWCFILPPPLASPAHTLLWPVNTLWTDRSLPSRFWCCCWPLLVVFSLLLYYASRNPQCTRNPKSQQTYAFQHYIIYKAVSELAMEHTQTKRTSIPVLYKQQSNTLHTVHCVHHYGKARFLASRFLHSNNTQHAQKLQCGPMLMSVHFSPFAVPRIWFMLQHVDWPQSSKRKMKTSLNPCSVSQHLERHQRILDFVMQTQ